MEKKLCLIPSLCGSGSFTCMNCKYNKETEERTRISNSYSSPSPQRSYSSVPIVSTPEVKKEEPIVPKKEEPTVPKKPECEYCPRHKHMRECPDHFPSPIVTSIVYNPYNPYRELVVRGYQPLSLCVTSPCNGKLLVFNPNSYF